jgi:peroxiredoxin
MSPRRPEARRRQKWVLAGGCLLALVALLFWRPLQRGCAAYFLLRSEAPSPEALSAAVEQAGDPASLLLRLWNTQRIPHRQFVTTYLSTATTSKPALVKKLEPVVFEATVAPDIATREAAFATLARTKHPRLRTLALEQLSDADPAARLIALQSLRSIANSNDVPVVMRLLDDPEPRVVVAAALLLRQATGQDFGIRSTHAIPQFTCIETNPPPPPDLPAISQGVQRWHDWWTTHQAAYPPPCVSPPPRPHAAALPTPDFTLDDSAGMPIRLSQFRGKSVLLAFWSLGAPASLDDFPALNALHQHNTDRLAILGICTPLPPDCCAEEHEHGHGSASEHAHHHHDDSAATAAPPTVTTALAQATAERLHLKFPMLLDPKGTVALRFSANDFPTYILLDSQGLIRRRFVGFRSESTLAAMLEEVADPKALAASARPHNGSH